MDVEVYNKYIVSVSLGTLFLEKVNGKPKAHQLSI